MNKVIAMAFKNLKRNKRRNLSTGIAIALGFAGLLLLGGYVFRVQNYLRVYTIFGTRKGHLAIYKKKGLEKYTFKPQAYSLSPDEQKKLHDIIGRLSNVEFFGSHLLGTGLLGNGCKTMPFLAFGMEPDLMQKLYEHPQMLKWAPNIRNFKRGRGLWNFSSDIGPIAVSTGLVRYIGKDKVYDDLKNPTAVVVVDCLSPDAKTKVAADTNVQMAAGTWDGRLSAIDGEVVAHFSTGQTETNNASILVPIKRLQTLYETDNVTFQSVFLKDIKYVEATRKELIKQTAAAGLAVDIYTWDSESLNPFYTGTLQFLYTMVGFIVCVLCAVIVFAILNSATMTVIERSQEIGMLRSLGYTKRRIRLLYVCEMLILAAFALVGGGVVAIVSMLIVNQANIQFNPPGVAGGLQLLLIPNVWVTLLAATVVVTLAIIATWVAVKTIARKNIAGLLLATPR